MNKADINRSLLLPNRQDFERAWCTLFRWRILSKIGVERLDIANAEFAALASPYEGNPEDAADDAMECWTTDTEDKT